MGCSHALHILLCILILSPAAMAATQNDLVRTPVPASIVSLEPRFDRLVPKGAKLVKIADGFTWVEGPV